MAPWFRKKDKKADPVPTSTTPAAAAAAVEPAAPSTPKGVQVSKLLIPDLIVVRPQAADKEKLIELLVGRLCQVRGLGDPSALLKKVLEREQGISTTLDTGLSLPHARVEGLVDIVTVLAIVPQGVPDPKQPDLTIRAMFLFFSPSKQEAFTRHLHLLRSVSAMFQAAFVEKLLTATTPDEALDFIKKAER